jgi:hypothetical protein
MPEERRRATQTLPAGFTPMNPIRILDTRTGTGGRTTPFGQSDVWPLVVAGRNGIPNDASSVIFNVTVVNPTNDTYLLVWSGSQPQPLASSANVDAGTIKGSMVITRLINGNCAIYNYAGTAHVIVDVLGYFSPTSQLGIVAAPPRRLLDTRDSGAPLTAETINIPVRGWAGVSPTTDAVALNVTATDATTPSFITVWPAKTSDPGTSNVNIIKGDTVPNLAVTRLSEDGWISLRNNAGRTHVIVDVLATFERGAPGRLVAVDPIRVLDTRVRLGTPPGWTNGELTLPIRGSGPVPGTNVIGAVLSVIAVSPDDGTYVSVYPAGTRRPATSNLNVRRNGTGSNLVLSGLGETGSITFQASSPRAQLIADIVAFVTA